MKALITGGEGDLARHIRAELESAGWDVLAPGRAELDVLDPKSYFAQLDRLDLLINNAGVFRDAPLIKMSEEDFDAVVDVNLKGENVWPVASRLRESGVPFVIASVAGAAVTLAVTALTLKWLLKRRGIAV